VVECWASNCGNMGLNLSQGELTTVTGLKMGQSSKAPLVVLRAKQ